MNRITPLSIVFLFASLLAGCGQADSGIPVTGQESALQLNVESPNGESVFPQGNEAITYNYVVTNTGPQSLRGPVIVNDAPRQVTCPQLETVGDLDGELDFNESVTCTAVYTPSESDRQSGSITNRAQAIVGGMVSNESTFTLGQAGSTLTVEGAAGISGASSTPTAFPTGTQSTAAESMETPSVVPATTQGASADATGTPLVIATATQETSADPTGTPLDIPTATEFSSSDAAPGPTASADSVNVVDLPAGTDTIVLPGIVPAGASIRYSIDASPGQQLSLNFIVTTNQLTVRVTGPDGAVVKTPEAALPWSGAVSSTGEYLIEILNADSTTVQPYVLELRRTPAN